VPPGSPFWYTSPWQHHCLTHTPTISPYRPRQVVTLPHASCLLFPTHPVQHTRREIEPFIPGILDGDTTFEAYLQRMAHPAAWGGEPEMVMAASVVRMPIHVWRVTPAGAELIVTYGDELRGPTPPINVLWHRAGHYDLLVSDLPPAASAA